MGAYIGNYFGGGTGLIWLDNLHCNGSETSLANCRHHGWGLHNCGHREDVSIFCGDDGTLHASVPHTSSLYRPNCCSDGQITKN